MSCQSCGAPVGHPGAEYCSPACYGRAYQKRLCVLCRQEIALLSEKQTCEACQRDPQRATALTASLPRDTRKTMARRAVSTNQMSLFDVPAAAPASSGGSDVARASPVPDMPMRVGEQPEGGDTTSGDTHPSLPAGSFHSGGGDVFDEELSERARDIGIARVEASTDEWQSEAVTTIREIATKQVSLTTDDVWAELGRDDDIEGRAMGAAMRMAAKLGYIRRTNTTQKSVRVACHRRDLRIWESLLCRA